MWRLQYRNRDGVESLVADHTVDVDGTDRAGIRRYELQRRGGSSWTIAQQGTYSPDATHRWMGSVAMGRQGNIALGFSIASESLFPSIYYVGRLAADPPGTLPRPERVLVRGGGSQTSFTGRGGDYSHLAVDPLDDCTFYYTNEYYGITASRDWRTRVGAFRFSCVAASSRETGGAGPPSVPGSADAVARGNVDDADKPRRKTEQQRQQRERTNRAGLDDYRTEGNVVGVRCSVEAPAPPGALGPESDEDVPYVLIATRDGHRRVRLLPDPRAACPSVRVVDHLEADGTKQHEALFDAEGLTTSRPRRYGPRPYRSPARGRAIWACSRPTRRAPACARPAGARAAPPDRPAAAS